MDNVAALKRLTQYWQTLTLESVAQVGAFYADDATFRDPFNDVKGLATIKHIFVDMFARTLEPHFAITETILEENRALLIWDFTYRLKSLKPTQLRKIHGTSVIYFGADGRVLSHRDYWDAAEELYAQLPVIGILMRWLKRKMT